MIAEKIKLNLGCRARPIEGFKGMDCEAHKGVDFVGDVSDLKQFDDGCVSEMYASHILEHFSHVRTKEVLQEWARVIEPGGTLYIAVPDFKRVVELYEIGGITPWLDNFLHGDQIYPTAVHYPSFDFSKLERLLRYAGFSEVSQVDQFPVHAEGDCSTLVHTWDNKSVSLNVVALKED